MNALQELLAHIQNNNKFLLCASISWQPTYNDEDNKSIVLKEGYTTLDYRTFLDQLDFEYNDSYGTQYLYGTLWYTDGTWSTRGEYDGSEWWVLHELPPIPDECKGE